jgi:hypothetical protein
MNTKTILLALVLVVTQAMLAQNFDPAIYQVGKKYPGYVIKLNNDTVRGFIEAKERCAVGGVGYSNQNRCEFYLNETDRKATEKYGPKDIKGYMIADKFYKSIAYSGGLMKSNNFCLQTRIGRISSYVWYSTKDGFVNMNRGGSESQEDFDKRRYEADDLYQKLDEDPVTWTKIVMSYAKVVPAMMSDYPDLAEKIKNKEKGYKIDHFFDALEEYNKYFASKN